MSFRRVVVLASVLQAPLLAEQPLGSEFRVNTYTTTNQRLPSVASDAAGNFVVVWESQNGDGSSYGVFGQRYGSSGVPLGGEFQVNSYTTGGQRNACVSASATGGFVVVWQAGGQDGSGYGIFARRYTSDGAPAGADFRVNTTTAGDQRGGRLATDSAGNFVVVWQSQDDGSLYGAFGQRFDQDGARLGTEFRINSTTSDQQKLPWVASTASGGFVVVWQGNLEDGSGYGVFGQRYASAGAPLGSVFRVNTYTSFGEIFMSVDSDSAGNFLVVWQAGAQDGSSYGIFARRYTSAGAPRGVEFRVNTYTTGDQWSPRAATDGSGNFVVSWIDFSKDGSSIGIYAQRFSSTGALLGAEFRVNTFTTDIQTSLIRSIASDAQGNFVIAWGSAAQDGSDYGVFAQRYCVFPLTSVSISLMGSSSLCNTLTTGGTATVTDVGGGAGVHQWAYRTTSLGAATPISSATGSSYQLQAPDFGGTAGVYYLICFSVPECGSIQASNEITVFIADDMSVPVVTPPPGITEVQTLCQ